MMCKKNFHCIINGIETQKIAKKRFNWTSRLILGRKICCRQEGDFCKHIHYSLSAVLCCPPRIFSLAYEYFKFNSSSMHKLLYRPRSILTSLLLISTNFKRVFLKSIFLQKFPSCFSLLQFMIYYFFPIFLFRNWKVCKNIYVVPTFERLVSRNICFYWFERPNIRQSVRTPHSVIIFYFRVSRKKV